jgi:hypothetical protein
MLAVLLIRFLKSQRKTFVVHSNDMGKSGQRHTRTPAVRLEAKNGRNNKSCI